MVSTHPEDGKGREGTKHELGRMYVMSSYYVVAT